MINVKLQDNIREAPVQDRMELSRAYLRNVICTLIIISNILLVIQDTDFT